MQKVTIIKVPLISTDLIQSYVIYCSFGFNVECYTLPFDIIWLIPKRRFATARLMMRNDVRIWFFNFFWFTAKMKRLNKDQLKWHFAYFILINSSISAISSFRTRSSRACVVQLTRYCLEVIFRLIRFKAFRNMGNLKL